MYITIVTQDLNKAFPSCMAALVELRTPLTSADKVKALRPKQTAMHEAQFGSRVAVYTWLLFALPFNYKILFLITLLGLGSLRE